MSKKITFLYCGEIVPVLNVKRAIDDRSDATQMMKPCIDVKWS
jgi:hypothetical protein